MAGLYPTEARPSAPPSYAEAVYHSQAPPYGHSTHMGTQTTMYGRFPMQCTCPNCKRMIATRVEKRTGLLTWLACIVVACFGGCLGCCLIPFFMNRLKDTEHYCSCCGAMLGERRML